jgi:hypothetical protein
VLNVVVLSHDLHACLRLSLEVECGLNAERGLSWLHRLHCLVLTSFLIMIFFLDLHSLQSARCPSLVVLSIWN